MFERGVNSGWQTAVINIWVWFKRKVIEYALVVGTQRLFVVFSWTCNNFISLIILALSKSGILWQVTFCKYDTYFSHPGRLLFSIHSPWRLFKSRPTKALIMITTIMIKWGVLYFNSFDLRILSINPCSNVRLNNKKIYQAGPPLQWTAFNF